MIRKLTVIFLSVLICVWSVIPVIAGQYNYVDLNTGKVGSIQIKKFNEPPTLKVKVAAGELLPVEERLPEDPLVVKPIEKIGQYGGVWRMDAPMGSLGIYSYQLVEKLVDFSIDFQQVLPNVAEDWKFSKDAKSVTFFLRKGMKWSDGSPLTADDFMFWYEDIQLNKELTPILPNILKYSGESVVMEKVDDYTIRFSFAKPFGMFIEQVCCYQNEMVAPKHYLKQFHPRYTPMEKIEKIMKKEDFDTWADLFRAKNTAFNNPELPTIDAWMPINTVDKPMHVFVRNPYYWKVDPEGNQLPYIDQIQRTSSDMEARALKIIAGQIDYQWFWAGALVGMNYSLYMQNREKGNYRLVPLSSLGTNEFTIFFNLFHKDPVLRKLFRDKQFRIALSIAINRVEMSELLFDGMYIPAQPGPAPGTPWYEERFCNYYIEYDPKRANEILDEMGLKWDENHEYRLRPDGERLRFVMMNWSPWHQTAEANELIKEYWKKVGIELVIKPTGGPLWISRIEAGNYDVACHIANQGFPTSPPVNRTDVFPMSSRASWAPQWGLWFQTNGKEGEEPPVEVKRLMEIREKILGEISASKRIELSKEALAIHAENMWMIGCLRPPSIYVVTNNNLRNVPAVHPYFSTFVSAQLFFLK